MNGLPISGIVEVNINATPVDVAAKIGCNKGLIIGTSAVIIPGDRVKSFKNFAEVVYAGFTDAMPEHLAAKKYFAQKPAPKLLYIGRHDAAATEPVETLVQAIPLCLEKAEDAYGVYVCGASDADITQATILIELEAKRMVFFESSNNDCLVAAPAADDIFTSLSKVPLERAIGIYSEVPYAGAGLMGLALGRETGLENSAFSLSYLTLEGVAAEPVTPSEYSILMAKNGNVVANRGQNYKLLHMGRTLSGVSYDDVMYIDMTQNAIEDRVMAAVAGTRTKLPQTDAGMAVVIAAVTNAREYMVDVGYVAEGIWNGDEIKSLLPGDVLAGGFMIFAESFASLSQQDREARKAPPITVAIKTSGTIESVVINVNVNL